MRSHIPPPLHHLPVVVQYTPDQMRLVDLIKKIIYIYIYGG